MAQSHIAYKCPHCETNYLETAATLPYVRGYLLAYQAGRKTLVGCRSCVRKELLKETGKSALLGWFSPSALIANPFLLIYGLGRACFVGTNLDSVRAVLKEAGISEPQEPLDIVKVAYSLAASMIAADHKIAPEEIEVASQIGGRILDGFDVTAFRKVVDNHRNLPEASELAGLLCESVPEEGRALLLRYLSAIAAADGQVAREEQALLDRIADGLGLSRTTPALAA